MAWSHSSEDLLRTAVTAAKRGGEVLQSWTQRFTVAEKSRANLVTEADFESQKAILELISSRYPTHAFLGEEGLERVTDSEYRWIIDPLDGTSNYVHGFPYYCVSIGLEIKGELTLGVIFDPNRQELFACAEDITPKCNDSPIKPSQATKLGDAFAVASLPVGTRREDIAVSRFLNVLPEARTVQRTGSAALNLAYIACGRIDAFWSSSLKPWDMAAGIALVRQAGGIVTEIEGPAIHATSPSILACASAELHEELMRHLKPENVRRI